MRFLLTHLSSPTPGDTSRRRFLRFSPSSWESPPSVPSGPRTTRSPGGSGHRGPHGRQGTPADHPRRRRAQEIRKSSGRSRSFGPLTRDRADLVPGQAELGSLLVLGVDLLGDREMRDYGFEGEDADIDDPLLFLAQPDSALLARSLADRAGVRPGGTFAFRCLKA